MGYIAISVIIHSYTYTIVTLYQIEPTKPALMMVPREIFLSLTENTSLATSKEFLASH